MRKHPLVLVGFCRGIPWPMWPLGAIALGLLLCLYLSGKTTGYYSAAERICLSIISSLIFYLIVARWKEWRDQRKVSPYLHARTKMVIGTIKLLFQAIETEVTGAYKSVGFPSTATLQAQCAALTLTTPASRGAMFHHEDRSLPNWIEQMHYMMNQTQPLIDEMFGKMAFLDADYVVLLTSIRDSVLFHKVKEYKRQCPDLRLAGNTPLSLFYGDLEGLKRLAERLEVYSNRRYREYGGD